jgi:hypothetical protein
MADMIIKNIYEKTCILIDVAMPAERNVTQKEAEKKLKYMIFLYYSYRASCYNHYSNQPMHWVKYVRKLRCHLQGGLRYKGISIQHTNVLVQNIKH